VKISLIKSLYLLEAKAAAAVAVLTARTTTVRY
jgi:hypothetical protein